MFKRILSLMGVFAVILAVGAFVPAAYAAIPNGCTPTPGTGTTTDDLVNCNGDDANGVNVGSGNDEVDINSGTVMDTIISEGGALLVVLNGGTLDTSGDDHDAIFMDGDGNVTLQGDLTAECVGIHLNGDGQIESTGDITAGLGIYQNGDGQIESTGDLHLTNGGITIYGTGEVLCDGSESLDSSSVGILLYGDGTIVSNGNISSLDPDHDTTFDLGLLLLGSGKITSNGNIDLANGYGIAVLDELVLSSGDKEVINNGNINLGDGFGIMVQGYGQVTVTSTGNINVGDGAGMFVINGNSESEITSTGDITVGDGVAIQVISIMGNGQITSVGDINVEAGQGIFLSGDGQIDSTGDITIGSGGAIQILGNGTINSTGNINVGNSGALGLLNISGSGAIFIAGSGDISSSGNITSDGTAIYLGEDGSITVNGNVIASNVGIGGGEGNQHVQVNGSVSVGIESSQNAQVDVLIAPPTAVRLGGGDDSLNVASESSIYGDIDMGSGDDTVIIADHAVVDGTIEGGEGDEVAGDTLIIGNGTFCTDDGLVVAAIDSLNASNPDSGSITYLGQSYTWIEFEHIASGAHLRPCVSKINDGRINAYDLGAPNALYCTVGGGFSAWRIDLQGQGTFSFAVTAAQIQAAFDTATATGVNQLIGAGSFGDTLYALSDGRTLNFFAPDLREPGKTYEYTYERNYCPGA